MVDDIEDGLIESIETLAKNYIVARVIWWILLILLWPFVSLSRIIFFVFSFGKIRPDYRESLEHTGIVMLALIILMPTLFYVHIVYGAGLYGASA